MSRIGLFFVGVCVVAVSAAGCGDETEGGGGSGGGGAAGTGGAGGTGGQSAVPRPCASEWASPPPPEMPVGSNMCTYDFPSMGPPTRDCTQQDGSQLLYEYDATKPCGMPCVTGRLRGFFAIGTHFDGVFLPLAESQSIVSGSQFNRIEYDVDQFGNEFGLRTFDADDQPMGSGTTTYDPPGQERPTSFETRIDGMPTVISSGTMTWNNEGQLETYEEIIPTSPNPRAFFTYAYNPDGTFDVVTWEGEIGVPVGTFTFSYAPVMVTVTFDLADGTPDSILTFDYVCAP